MKGARNKPSASYTGSHANKVKSTTVSGSEAGGKMTKFKSLDEIPDASPDFDWGSNGDTYGGDENYGDSGYSPSYKVVANSPPIRGKPDSRGNASMYYHDKQDQHAAGKADLSPKAKASKIPPLPYDQHKNASKPEQRNGAHASNQNQIPVPPSSKYFDYDNGNDNFDDDDEVYSPKSKVFAIHKADYSSMGAAVGAGARSPEFVPPLPCETKETKGAAGGKGAVSEQDSIYFSKKPRPVNFKPYTMKQYKMIQPKEYVEISNIKPDLNSEELVAKRANLDRIKEFSRNLQSYNRQVIGQQPKLPSASEKHDIAVSEQKYNSRRQKAIEFAKNVPKPKVPSSQQRGAGAGAGGGAGGDYDDSEYADQFGNNGGQVGQSRHADSGMNMGADYAKESRIMELEAQHNNRKIQMEVIRKTLGMK